MRLSNKTRHRSQAASITLSGHHRDLPTTVQPLQSGSELRVQSTRLSRNHVNERNTIDVVSCDCSVSTLGDEFSHDDGSHVVLLTESPGPTHHHKWKQMSGGDLREVDMPPIGPIRSIGCFDDSSNYASGNDATTSRRQRSILASDFEPSEATDINEDFSTHIQSTKTAVEELLEDLRMEHKQRQSLDFTPKPVGRSPSDNIKNIKTNANGRRIFELPTRLPSESSLETISPPTKERTFSLHGSREALNGSREGLRSVDTPPSIAKRKASQHVRDWNSDEEDCSDYDYEDDDSFIVPTQSENQRIPSDRPPEQARRLMSPSPLFQGNIEVSLDSSAIGVLDIEATQQV